MTRAQLDQVREALWTLIDVAEGEGALNCANSGRESLAILDAELAKPEAREWRVLAEDHSQCFTSEAEADAAADWLRTNDAGSVYVDSRTVGPWERAEVNKIEGEKK